MEFHFVDLANEAKPVAKKKDREKETDKPAARGRNDVPVQQTPVEVPPNSTASGSGLQGNNGAASTATGQTLVEPVRNANDTVSDNRTNRTDGGESEQSDDELDRCDELTRKQADELLERKKNQMGREFKAHQKAVNRAYTIASSEKVDTLDYQGLKVRNDDLFKQWKEGAALYWKLIRLVDDAIAESYEDCFTIMEEEYFDASAVFGKKLQELERAIQVDSRPASEVGNVDATRFKLVMPSATIPNTWGKFDGNRQKWLGFRDRYLAAVHNNPDVDESYKNMHLTQSLIGEAAKVLGERQTAGDSYQQAWERILEKYDRPYAIASDVMNDFYKLPVIQPPASANALENMSNKTHEVIRQLRALKYPVEHWDFVLVHALHERLDDATSKEWEKMRNGDNEPKITQMLEFLDKEAAASKRTTSRESLTVSVSNERALDRPIQSRTGTIKKTFQVYPCEVCPRQSGETHRIFDCPNFLAMSPIGRKDFALRRRLCLNCLKKGHTKANCDDPRYCTFTQCRDDPKHNSLLCVHKPSNQVSANHGAVGGKRSA